MSMSTSPPSSLRVLERYNHSKSTVSSSDTDADSAGYASSSGTTTPEDDAQTFDLGHTLQSVLADKPKRAPEEKLTIVTKHRNISSAIKRVKKVAHALGVFKKKVGAPPCSSSFTKLSERDGITVRDRQRPDDISPILISSPLRERFGKRMSVKPHPDEVCRPVSLEEVEPFDIELDVQGFYSLPNRRFSLSDVSTPSVSLDSYPVIVLDKLYVKRQHHPRAITRKFGTISGSTSIFVKGTLRKKRSGLRMPSFSDLQRSAPPSLAPTTVVPRTRHDVLAFVHMLRILLFVPWCAAVGGALLLFPNYVDLVTFRSGYLPPPKGIRRFAYWAECGQQHVMIFLACFVTVLWYHHTLGLSLTSIAVSRFVFVWHAFEVDKNIPLGEDDQQSLYLVIMGLASADGSFSVSRPRGGRTEVGTDNSA